MKSNFRTILISIIPIFFIFLVSCDPSKKYEKAEASEIQDFIAKNANINFEKKQSGLYYVDVTVGTGRAPINNDTVWVKYTGKFLSGTTFDTNVGTTDSLKFPVYKGYLIYGFEEAISYMKAGGKSMVVIPSSLAYGTTGYNIIGGYTPLQFDIELVKVKAGPGK
jgi:FKBP-type peptidyl-prolyl cis-trans isomerase FkpA